MKACQPPYLPDLPACLPAWHPTASAPLPPSHSVCAPAAPPPPLLQLAGESRAAANLLALSVVINQAVGDALSGILLVEAALRRKAWGLDAWAALYTDLPSRQAKVTVADRTVIVTTDAETRVAAPAGLQAAIDDPALHPGVMVINISLRMLHSSKQPAWQRPLVAALQDTLRTTPVGAWFFGQLANAKVGEGARRSRRSGAWAGLGVWQGQRRGRSKRLGCCLTPGTITYH